MLEILPVTNNRLLKAFINVPWPIYRDDPAWVPPLLLERRMALSPREPIFQHLTWRAWLAVRSGRPVGRISAQIDALHQARYGPGTGFFGLVEGEDDPAVFAALFEAAEGWLRGQGAQRIVGPLSLNINQEVGLLVEGYDSPPSFLMGHARPYYHPHIQALDYRPCQHTVAYRMPCAYEETAAVARVRQRLGKRLRIRPIDRANKASELAQLRDIFNDAWAANWDFVPFTEAEFKAVGDLLLLTMPADFVLLAELDGQVVGFIVMIPNLNEAIADLNGRLLPWGWLKLLWRLKVRVVKSGRVPLMGVRRRLQDGPAGATIALSLIHRCREATLKYGMVSAELSWILEGNKGMRSIIERIGGEVCKRYVCYEKGLAPRTPPCAERSAAAGLERPS